VDHPKLVVAMDLARKRPESIKNTKIFNESNMSKYTFLADAIKNDF